MNLKHIAKIVGVASAVPMLLLANSGSAFADGYGITWQDAQTHGCLYWQWHDLSTSPTGTPLYSLSTDAPTWPHCGGGNNQGPGWDDIQEGLENQTGQYWAEKVNGSNYCLTAYWGNMAYIEPCSSPINYYEQWQEQWTGSGFNLVNRETKTCLDSNSNGAVYTLGCNGGQYQLWK